MALLPFSCYFGCHFLVSVYLSDAQQLLQCVKKACLSCFTKTLCLRGLNESKTKIPTAEG